MPFDVGMSVSLSFGIPIRQMGMSNDYDTDIDIATDNHVDMDVDDNVGRIIPADGSGSAATARSAATTTRDKDDGMKVASTAVEVTR